MARIDQFLEYASDEFNYWTGEVLHELFVYPKFLNMPLPSEDRQEELIQNLKLTYQKLDSHLEYLDTKYMVGDDITLADFYVYTLVMYLVESDVVQINEFQKLQNWYQTMKQNIA